MLIILLMFLVFTAMQGAVVFATAYFGVRVLKARHPAWKFVAMILSLAAWIGATGVGYAATGGSFSLFHGLMFVLALCATATASSVVYLVGWVFWPQPGKSATAA